MTHILSLPPTSGAASGVRQLVIGVRQNAKAPFAEDDRTDQPVSFTPPAKANEVMAASYSHLYQLPATGLRFYRVWPGVI